MTDIFSRFTMQTDDARALLKILPKVIKEAEISEIDTQPLYELQTALEEVLA